MFVLSTLQLLVKLQQNHFETQIGCNETIPMVKIGFQGSASAQVSNVSK